MRIAYTMIRVADLNRSVTFYTDVLGMTLFRREEYPTGRFTLAFLGYGEETSGATVELTWNWDITAYDRGNAWGHIAIAVDNVYAHCAELEARGAKIIRPAGPMAHLSPQRGHKEEVIAFLEDPDGYRIELVPEH